MNISGQQKRVQFDFEVEFLNGGGIQGQGFRLDIDGDDIDDRALAQYIVQDLRLLMVGRVLILNKSIIVEPHKRSSAREAVAGRETAAAKTLIDLSHTMVDNTGTCIDSPFHRFSDDTDIAGLSLNSLVDLETVVVHVDGMTDRNIPAEAFGATDVRNKAVLVHSGWARHWRTDQYRENHPFLTAAAAEYLKDAGATLVGIDSFNIDDTADTHRPVHTLLLRAGIPIVEHLRGLELVPAHGARFTAVPPEVSGIGPFPVRAYATVA